MATTFLLWLLCIVPATRPERPSPWELYDEKKYAAALREIAVRLSRDDAAGDRVELLLLRADCQMRVGTSSLALAALRDAVEADQPGPRRDRAEATILVLKESARFIYRPARRQNSPTTRPLDLREPGERQQAIVAFFGDQVAEFDRSITSIVVEKVDRAAAKKAAEILRIAPLERAATGSDAESRRLLGRLADFTIAQVSAEVAVQRAAFDELKTAAKEMVEGPDGKSVERGITPALQAQAGQVAAACDREARLVDDAGAYSDEPRRTRLAELRKALHAIYDEAVRWGRSTPAGTR